MIRNRSDDQVRASASQMDAALDAGLTAERLAVLVAARQQWHATGQLTGDAAQLRQALADPAATVWDEVFVSAARKLSAPIRNVRP